jgi:hypothetical protein
MRPDAELIQAIAFLQDPHTPPEALVASARALFEASGGDVNDAMADPDRAKLALFGCGSAAVRGLRNAIDTDSPWAVACLLLIRNLARDADESAKLVHQHSAGQVGDVRRSERLR